MALTGVVATCKKTVSLLSCGRHGSISKTLLTSGRPSHHRTSRSIHARPGRRRGATSSTVLTNHCSGGDVPEFESAAVGLASHLPPEDIARCRGVCLAAVRGSIFALADDQIQPRFLASSTANSQWASRTGLRGMEQQSWLAPDKQLPNSLLRFLGLPSKPPSMCQEASRVSPCT